MRYRTLDPDADMTFGQGGLNFYVNSPEAVAQAIMTRLRLEVGEWFLDLTEGTPYRTQVLGYGSAPSRDIALRDRILETEGVTEMLTYSSILSASRKLSVNARVDTIYGALDISISSAGPDPQYGVLDFSISGNGLIVVIS